MEPIHTTTADVSFYPTPHHHQQQPPQHHHQQQFQLPMAGDSMTYSSYGYRQDNYAPTNSVMMSTHSPLKRKSPCAVDAFNSMAGSVSTPSSCMGIAFSSVAPRCQVCDHSDPILFAPKCGHTFHSRCVHAWPMTNCPVCDLEMDRVGVLRIDMSMQLEQRSGKWTREEEKFVDSILLEFDNQSFPLANGTPVRLVLARLLNCSPMRLSKKFQKNALGKRTFRLPKPVDQKPVKVQFDKERHVARQCDFSRMESQFLNELRELCRRETNSDLAASAEVNCVRYAVMQFWVSNFLKFAVYIGQKIEGVDLPDNRKRKQALQKLREGRYEELLNWKPAATSYSMIPRMERQVSNVSTMSQGSCYEWESPFVVAPVTPMSLQSPQNSMSSMMNMQGTPKRLKTPTNSYVEIPYESTLNRVELEPIDINSCPPQSTIPGMSVFLLSPSSSRGGHHSNSSNPANSPVNNSPCNNNSNQTTNLLPPLEENIGSSNNNNSSNNSYLQPESTETPVFSQFRPMTFGDYPRSSPLHSQQQQPTNQFAAMFPSPRSQPQMQSPYHSGGGSGASMQNLMIAATSMEEPTAYSRSESTCSNAAPSEPTEEANASANPNLSTPFF